MGDEDGVSQDPGIFSLSPSSLSHLITFYSFMDPGDPCPTSLPCGNGEAELQVHGWGQVQGFRDSSSPKKKTHCRTANTWRHWQRWLEEAGIL